MYTETKHSNGRAKRLRWEDWLKLAGEYKDTHGDLLVPSKYKTPEGYRLGRWVDRQRGMYNGTIRSSLSSEKVIALEQIGMVWKLEYRAKWNSWMEQVEKYYREHGNLQVPTYYETGQYRLGYWIKEQRKKYGSGVLEDRKVKDLEKYGMVWSFGHHREWDEWYEDAKKYYNKHHDLLVPADYQTSDGNPLGQWIFVQRSRYLGRTGRRPLDPEQIAKLDKIGMIWEPEELKLSRWYQMYDWISEYREKTGKLPVWPSADRAPDGRRMGYWISMQRKLLKDGSLDRERIRMLEELGVEIYEEGAVAI